MIYKQKGEQFLYKGACYKIGGRVLTTKASGYEGLFGRLVEIHTSREGVPELYCTFDTPALPSKRGMLEGASHEFRSAVLHTDCLAYHASIMTPEMVMPLASPEQDYVWQVIYAVTAHWATDGESGAYELPFTDLNDAKRQLQDDLWEEFQNGCVERWREKSQFVEMETEQSYECYLDGEYSENHYFIAVEQRLLYLSPSFLKITSEQWMAQKIRDDFLHQAKGRRNDQKLTAEQWEQICHSPEVMQRLLSQIKTSCTAYRRSLSEAAESLLEGSCLQIKEERPDSTAGAMAGNAEKSEQNVKERYELEYLFTFVEASSFEQEILCDQLVCLWTAFCLHNKIDVKADRYSTNLHDLWDQLLKNEEDLAYLSGYESFALSMGRYLR